MFAKRCLVQSISSGVWAAKNLLFCFWNQGAKSTGGCGTHETGFGEGKNRTQTHGKALQFTASIGIATMTRLDKSIDSLLQEADSVLFKAKQSGRNRVVNSF